jgi:hypothetical protein
MTQGITPFPTPKAGKISLLVAPTAVTPSLMAMIAALSLRGPACVIDGGNRFDGYTLARTLRRQTPNIQGALERVWLSRAFTCYQMVAVLAKLPADGTPVIVLDILATFLDENIHLSKRQNLLERALSFLRRFSRSAPVALWARLRSAPGAEDEQLLASLLEAAHDIWELGAPERPTFQLPLF